MMHARTEANPLLLWYGILIGSIATGLCEVLSYILDQPACSTGHFYVFHIVSVATFVMVLSGAWTGWMESQKLGAGEEHGGNPPDRSWFMAHLGIWASFGFALVIIALSIPHFILSPCD